MLREELSWVALDALGTSGHRRRTIREGGGSWSALREHPRRGAAIAAARQVLPFLHGGGFLIGGAQDIPRCERERPPLLLYGRGAARIEDSEPAVAVVGSRRATPRGAQRAHAIGRELAARGVVVVSGAAPGIDRAAHEGAVDAGGRTVAVLGQPVHASGADERPPWLRELSQRAPQRVGSVTPYGPWVSRGRWLFAVRNEWIAALADAVIVVEGAEGSGTRHTVNAAHRRKVRVFGVPGSVDDPMAAMPNQLLRGAGTAYLPGGPGLRDALGPAAGAGDPLPLPLPPTGARARPGVPAESVTESALLQALSGDGLDVDTLAGRLGIAAEAVLCELVDLELSGLVARDGPRFRRI